MSNPSVNPSEMFQVNQINQESPAESDFALQQCFNGFARFASVFNDQGEWVDCVFAAINPAFERMLGLKQDEVKGRSPQHVWPGPSVDWLPHFADVASKGGFRDFEWVHGLNRKTYQCRVCRPLTQTDSFFAFFEDISDRKHTEEAHRKSEGRYRLLFDLMDQGVAINEAVMDEQGEIVDYVILAVNPAFARHAPFKPEEVVGRFATEVYSMSPAYIREWWKHHATVTEPVHTEFYHEPSGTWHNITTTEIEGNRFITIFSNITDSKRAEAEREKLQAQLLQSQKMESVGTLAGGVAHDFNNMLSVILGYADLGLGQVEADSPLSDDLKQIIEAAQRAAGITRQLLAFARKQPISRKVLDLNDNVESMLKMLRRLIDADIELIWRPASKLWQVQMDPGQVDQILANLFVNARDAISQGGRVTIETGMATFAASDAAQSPGILPGEFVWLAVSDDGQGIEPEILNKIFEPFFTTKGIGEGTGLGLSTVYGIVQQNQGFIDVTSHPGLGTNFKIYLPRCQETLTHPQAELQDPKPFSQGETLLVVEDEPAMLNLTRSLLEKLHYQVLTAGSAEEALQVFSKSQATVDLLLTDVILPGMNGRALAERLQALKPNLKVLFMSGYPADFTSQRHILEPDQPFIQKPFAFQGLATKVRWLLDPEPEAESSPGFLTSS